MNPAAPSISLRSPASACVLRAGDRSRVVGVAFTLLEIIVVIVIISILAGAIVPRMLNVGRRQAELEAKAVQRLLSVAAEKSDVWNQPVAIDLIEDTKLSVYTRRADTTAATDAVGSATVKWQPDGLIEPVALNRLRISMATQDGVVLPSGKWRINMMPGQPRPAVSIQLDPKSEGDGPRWTISLAADDPLARRASGTEGGAAGSSFAAQSRTIDLDDAGKGQTPW